MNPLLALPYLPPISWCAVAWNAETIQLDGAEHYQKGSFRNRCHIAGPNGLQRLSIPLLKGKHQQSPIRDVRISYDEAWQRQHWRSIKTAYGNAPFYEHYADYLMPFYEKQIPFLFDFNLELLQMIFHKRLGWKGTIQIREDFAPKGNWEQQQDFRSGIEVSTTTPLWFQPVTYPQVFMDKTGFQPDLSILDLLFCFGKQGVEVLEQSILKNCRDSNFSATSQSQLSDNTHPILPIPS